MIISPQSERSKGFLFLQEFDGYCYELWLVTVIMLLGYCSDAVTDLGAVLVSHVYFHERLHEWDYFKCPNHEFERSEPVIE